MKFIPKSLSEQKRIVAILDEAFEGISAAVANAEKNLANARELFEQLSSQFRLAPTRIQEWRPALRESLADALAKTGESDPSHYD